MKKSIYLPIILLVYFASMMMAFAPDWIKSGHTLRMIITGIVELAMVVGLYFALRKKEKLKQERP